MNVLAAFQKHGLNITTVTENGTSMLSTVKNILNKDQIINFSNCWKLPIDFYLVIL